MTYLHQYGNASTRIHDHAHSYLGCSRLLLALSVYFPIAEPWRFDNFSVLVSVFVVVAIIVIVDTCAYARAVLIKCLTHQVNIICYRAFSQQWPKKTDQRDVRARKHLHMIEIDDRKRRARQNQQKWVRGKWNGEKNEKENLSADTIELLLRWVYNPHAQLHILNIVHSIHEHTRYTMCMHTLHRKYDRRHTRSTQSLTTLIVSWFLWARNADEYSDQNKNLDK